MDDLLKTSWEACQGSDVLIECPSAMGGIHIAEALGIPYFRAFTMPWTRTRAYPHAFAVPERKMGGSYNYMVNNSILPRPQEANLSPRLTSCSIKYSGGPLQDRSIVGEGMSLVLRAPTSIRWRRTKYLSFIISVLPSFPHLSIGTNGFE